MSFVPQNTDRRSLLFYFIGASSSQFLGNEPFFSCVSGCLLSISQFSRCVSGAHDPTKKNACLSCSLKPVPTSSFLHFSSSSVSQLTMESLMETGLGDFGCSHYRRRCKIRAPCCDEIYDCRHCHNESKDSSEVDPLDRHVIPRHELKRVQQECINCGVCMGKYFCSICKFFDDDVSKNQYHCDKCGICRTEGRENFFHCNKCGCCFPKSMKDSHNCVERALHHNCPVCFEFLFYSTKEVNVLPCGHTIHLDCVKEMRRHSQYACPLCSKSFCDMSSIWEKLDQEVTSTPMLQMYLNKMVWVLCNDCGERWEINFHVVAHKCPKCKSYNTKQTRGGPASCSSMIAGMVT